MPTADTPDWPSLLSGEGSSAAVQAEITTRLSRPDLGRWLSQVRQVRQCARPVRLVGGSDTIDPLTGEVLASYTSSSEPDGVTYIRCGNRRASVCPSCSREYKGDVWHVLMAGAAGGIKGCPQHCGRTSVGVRQLHRTILRTRSRREEARPARHPPLPPPHRQPASAVPARPAALVHDHPRPG